MTWLNGADLAEQVWDVIKQHVPQDKQKIVAKELIKIFESYGCDTMTQTEMARLIYKPCDCQYGQDENNIKYFPRIDHKDGINTCPKCKGEGFIKL